MRTLASATGLEMKPVAHLPINLPWIVIVKTSKREAVVQQSPSIRNILRMHGHRKILTDFLAQRQIGGHMPGQISRVKRGGWVLKSIRETGPIIDIQRRISTIRQIPIHADIQRVPLVMIQGRISRVNRARGRIRWRTYQASRNRTNLLCHLVGIGQVRLSVAPETRRANCDFPGLDLRSLYRDRDKDTGFADIAVVEKVL